MKVLNLRCGQQHAYEGWFASEEDFASQQGRGIVACPLCGDTEAVRLPSAPRLNVSRHAAPTEPVRSEPGSSPRMRAGAPGNIRATAGPAGSFAPGWYARQDDLIGYRAISRLKPCAA